MTEDIKIVEMTSERLAKMETFLANEVRPRISRKKFTNELTKETKDAFWEEYHRCLLIGTDIFKLMESNYCTRIKARELLDKFICPLRNVHNR